MKDVALSDAVGWKTVTWKKRKKKGVPLRAVAVGSGAGHDGMVHRALILDRDAFAVGCD